MTEPMHTIYIKSEDLQAQFICLGDQIAGVVRQVNELLPGLAWYTADIDYCGGPLVDLYPRVIQSLFRWEMPML